MLTKEEFREICEAVGGKKTVAKFLPVTVRAVEHWLAGTRRIQPPEEARIRELQRQTLEATK
ncbi:helix-turn-helix domain-containing protein [Singulisphaera rosea]